MKAWISRWPVQFALIAGVFGLAYVLPFERIAADSLPGRSGREALLMLQDYAREHVLLCLVPALFIAGAIAAFVSQASVLRYLGPSAHRVLSYGVAAVSGTILAACSCTVLPLFAGIYTRGAGLGPATAFLYSGPAINVLAIILTARVLGVELGTARAVGAVVFSVVIGVAMHLIYRKEEARRQAGAMILPEDAAARPLWKTGLYFAVLVGILVFANFRALDPDGIGAQVAGLKWWITAGLLVGLAVMLSRWFRRDELLAWVSASWSFAVQILPLLFGGVLVAGFLLGRPGHPGLIPESWIAGLVGSNSLGANFAAALVGALMYFATLTEVPILQGLMGSGMHKGPALALLLAGPALSLPNMLVIRSIMGTQKMIVYVALVVVMATISGMCYGEFGG